MNALTTILAGLLVLHSTPIAAATVAVRQREGLVHGFLELSSLEGKTLADGDLLQTSKGDTVTSRLVFHFRDGSTYDETAVFTQRGRFRLISNRMIQKGPAFPYELEATIDMKSGRVDVRQVKDGKEEKISARHELPDDLANGLILTLLKNISPETPKTIVSMLAITPKPRLVKLEFTPAATEAFATGAKGRQATRYNVKVDIKGIMGVLAWVLDKTPPDSSVWILGGEAPAFIKSESPFYAESPLWRIELVSPTWPRSSTAAPEKKD
ncbi:MAG TPA: hypothetical protein VFD71_18460 [Planctomycetota bacterium]|nr:hypothetical protein [Planctomycetota bacterium]